MDSRPERQDMHYRVAFTRDLLALATAVFLVTTLDTAALLVYTVGRSSLEDGGIKNLRNFSFETWR